VENLLVYIVNLNNETARKNHYTHQFSHIISNQLKWTPLNSSQSDTHKVKSPHSCKTNRLMLFIGFY